MDVSVEIRGLAELDRKLGELSQDLQVKALKSAAGSAVLPAVNAMKLAAPVGTVAHRTYKGRLVAPGFLKRSIRRRVRIENGKVVVTIGVRAEAYYGVLFVEKGTKNMPAHPWFVESFTGARTAIERRFMEQLQKRIEKFASR